MAGKALIPIGIMAVALGTMGTFAGGVGKRRQYHEHSLDWENGLKEVCGVVPPRTRIDPYIAPKHWALVGREIPIYSGGALLSQIEPGGPLDPYANPYPSPAAIAKEKARLLALPGQKLKEADMPTEQEWEELAAFKKQKEDAARARHKNVYREAPMAEYYRILAYQKLHPELTIDEAKLKLIDVEKLKHMH